MEIHTLGRFELRCDGKQIASARKAPRKVLDLLKRLVVDGTNGVTTATLAESLWPQVEGDAAQNNRKASMHRLRKLLGRDDAVVVRDGRFRIEPTVCRVDLQGLERVINHASGGRIASATRAQIESWASELLGVYVGRFLPDEDELPAVVAMRDQVRTKFRHAVILMGRALEAQESWEGAIALYRRAVELDNLCEEIY